MKNLNFQRKEERKKVLKDEGKTKYKCVKLQECKILKWQSNAIVKYTTINYFIMKKTNFELYLYEYLQF